MQISDKGLAFIKEFEGKYLKAYKDEVGVVTIGYGITNSDKADYKTVTGRDMVRMGDTITNAQADELLRLAIKRNYGPRVEKAFGKKLTQQVYDAGVSFDYNTGGINRASWVPTLIKEGPSASVHYRLSLWNKGKVKGKMVVLRGLTRRREGEWRIIHDGNYTPPK